MKTLRTSAVFFSWLVYAFSLQATFGGGFKYAGKPTYTPKYRAAPKLSSHYQVLKHTYGSSAASKLMKQNSSSAYKNMMKKWSTPRYGKKLSPAIGQSWRKKYPLKTNLPKIHFPKVNRGLSSGYSAIKKSNSFKAATQAAKAGNWKKYNSAMGQVKNQGKVWTPFQQGANPLKAGLNRYGQSGAPQNTVSTKPAWGPSGNQKAPAPVVIKAEPAKPGDEKPLSKPSWNASTPAKAPPPPGPVWHETPGQMVSPASQGPNWHDGLAEVGSAGAGPTWNEDVASEFASASGPVWHDGAAGSEGPGLGPVWSDTVGSTAPAFSAANASSSGPMWSDAAGSGELSSAGGPQWLNDAARSNAGALKAAASSSSSGLDGAAGPTWVGDSKYVGDSSALSEALSSALSGKPELKEIVSVSPGLKSIVEDALQQEEEKQAFVESMSGRRGKRKRTPEEEKKELLELKEKAILKALAAPFASAKAEAERAQARAGFAEDIANTLGGYQSPRGTPQDKVSIDISGLKEKPGQNDIHFLSVDERDKRGQGLRPEDLHLVTNDGVRPAGYVPEGLGSLNPKLKPGPAKKPVKPYKLEPYDPATGPPKDGMQRADGMVFSEDMGEWVGEDVYAAEVKRKADDLARKNASQKERDKAWAAHHEKNRDKTLEEELREISDRDAAHQRKIDLSDKVLDLRKRAEKAGTLSEGQLQALEASLQKAIDRGATEEELKKITKSYVKIGQGEWEATAAEREEGEAYAQLGLDVSKNLAQGASMAGGFASAPLGVAIEVGAAYAETGSLKKAGWSLAQNVLPVNAIAVLADSKNRNFQSFVFALVQDVGNVLDLKGAVDAVKDMTKTASKAAKATNGAKEVAETASKAGKRTSTLATYTDNLATDLKTVEARTDAFRYGRAKSASKVDVLEEAVKSRDPKRIKAAVLEVQADKHAMHVMTDRAARTGVKELDEASEAVAKEFKSTMNRAYEGTDTAVKKGIADRYGIDPEDVTVELPTNKTASKANSNAAAGGLGATPSHGGMDRDVTYYYHPKDAKGNYLLDANGNRIRKEVPSKISGPMYDEAFYDAVHGPGSAKKVKANLPEADAKKAFAENSHKYDQTITDSKHAEAYGGSQADLEVAFNGKDQHFTDPEQVGQVYAYKGDHWYEQAEGLFDKADGLKKAGKYDQYVEKMAKAEGLMEEGMRQTTKQFDKQLAPRVDEINKRLALAGKPPLVIPPRLQKAQNIMSKVGTDGWSPAEAQFALHQLGYSNPRQIGHEMGSFMESMQKLDPTKGLTRKSALPSFGLPNKNLKDLQQKMHEGPNQ